MQFGFAYDSAGNVTNAGSITVENKPLLVFSNDAFNMQIARIWSNKVELIGTASTNAFVTINNQPCDRQGERFRCWLTLTNLTDSFQTNIIVYATSNNVVASNSGTLFVAKPTETVSNSVAGYPLQDSRYALSWDGWSRLTSMESTNANPNFKLQFTYFADGQRASKTVLKKVGASWETNYVSALTFDGWNLISERIEYYANGISVATTNFDYLWCLDLQGQKDGKWGQSAGGIGGLISISESSGTTTNNYFPFSDHQGTVHGLKDGNGQIVAQYFYTPYGALIGESGAAKDVCPFRFQSQYLDKETGVYQWKRRYYDAVLCRWLSRDPLAEQADPNLFRFCGSDPVGRIDAFGLEATKADLFKGLASIFDLGGLGRKEKQDYITLHKVHLAIIRSPGEMAGILSSEKGEMWDKYEGLFLLAEDKLRRREFGNAVVTSVSETADIVSTVVTLSPASARKKLLANALSIGASLFAEDPKKVVSRVLLSKAGSKYLGMILKKPLSDAAELAIEKGVTDKIPDLVESAAQDIGTGSQDKIRIYHSSQYAKTLSFTRNRQIEITIVYNVDRKLVLAIVSQRDTVESETWKSIGVMYSIHDEDDDIFSRGMQSDAVKLEAWFELWEPNETK